MRLTVQASGRGKLQLRLPAYMPYKLDPKTKTQVIGRSGYTASGGHYYTYKSPEFELSAEPKSFSHDFKVSKVVGLVLPEIVLVGPGEMTVTKFRFEELPAFASR